MKQSYLTPSIEVRDFSKFHFAQNQGTCGPEILSGETLSSSDFANPSFDGACGYGDSSEGNQVAICLSAVIDPNLLNGLTVNTSDGNSFVTSNCYQDDVISGCDIAGYFCFTSGIYASDPCLISLECPDGTIIDACPPSSATCQP